MQKMRNVTIVGGKDNSNCLQRGDSPCADAGREPARTSNAKFGWRALTGQARSAHAKCNLDPTFTCATTDNKFPPLLDLQAHTQTAMEDEEDDLYGSAAPDAAEQAPTNGDAPVKTEQMDVSEESDEDSDDVRDFHRIHSKRIHSNSIGCAGHSNHN